MPQQQQPSALQLALFVIEEAIKEEPVIATAIQKLFEKGVPPPEAWNALRSNVADKNYRDYVPDSDLPPGEGG